MLTKYTDVTAYQTKDGSEIRELMHPGMQQGHRQSLAEAILQPGQQTLLHKHHLTEELYHITSGCGLMTLGSETFSIAPGDTVRILPGTAHNLKNNGDIPLRLLCCCCPPYSHEDTKLLES